MATGRQLFTITGHTDQVFSLAFSPDGGKLACTVDKYIFIYGFHAYDEEIERWLREAGVRADIGGQ